MKELVKGSRVLGYLERLYRQLNMDFFGGELETPVVTIQSTRGAYGHVTCGRVWKCKDSEHYELNIGAGTLCRPIEYTVSTLLHEMVHIYNLVHGIQDCSRNNTYHNKRFKDKAESVGLVVSYDKRIGWGITMPSDDLILYTAEQGWQDVYMYRDDGPAYILRPGGAASSGDSADDNAPVKKPSSTRKYECPCCGLSVRATRDVRIKCVDCDTPMTRV